MWVGGCLSISKKIYVKPLTVSPYLVGWYYLTDDSEPSGGFVVGVCCMDADWMEADLREVGRKKTEQIIGKEYWKQNVKK